MATRETRSDRDLKIFLFAGYALGYPLAVLPPVIIDPLLKFEAVFGSRTYPNSYICIFIYIALLGILGAIFCKKVVKIELFYFSVCIFIFAIIGSLWIFKPEVPHGNLVQVGLTTSFLSAVTIFIWVTGIKITTDVASIDAAGDATLDYLKLLFSFVRQGAFAGVALFGALLFGAFATDLKYNEMIASEKHDIFLLNLNVAVQMGFYVTYSIFGPVRYLFNINLDILSMYKKIAIQSDAIKREPKL